MEKYEFHPLASVFPMMSTQEHVDLVEDIKEHGLREPIVLYEGKILDGRNRYTACVEAGVDVIFREYLDDDPVAFVISLNLKRRHLGESQRSMAGGRLATLRNGQRKGASPIGEAATTQADAATMLNVGKRSIERAREVIDKGVPDLTNAVDQGDISVSAAAQFAKEVAPAEQAKLIAKHGSPKSAAKALSDGKKSRAKAAKTKAAKTKADEAAADKPKLDSVAPDINDDPSVALAKRIREANAQAESGSQDWCNGTLALAATLAEARRLFSTERDFAHWLGENELEYLDAVERQAYLNMAADLSKAKMLLSEMTQPDEVVRYLKKRETK